MCNEPSLGEDVPGRLENQSVSHKLESLCYVLVFLKTTDKGQRSMSKHVLYSYNRRSNILCKATERNTDTVKLILRSKRKIVTK